MTRSAVLPALLSFALAAALAWLAATQAARWIEARTLADVRAAMAEAGHDWATVRTDGLAVTLSGVAPDEATRFRALTAAGGVVDAARIGDAMDVAAREAIEPPRFALEILRRPEGISLIGLIPEGTDRQGILDGVARAAFEVPITDLLETADHPAPDGWEAAAGYGIEALAPLTRATISVTARTVAVTSLAETAREAATLEAELRRMAPEGTAVSLSIRAPRPVITPFLLRMVRDGAGARLEACAAGTEPGRRRILEAARAAGAGAEAECTVGIGAPGDDWADAAVAGIEALGAMGSGTLTLSDGDVLLAAASSGQADALEAAAGTLAATLGKGYALDTVLPEAEDAAAPEPAEFVATRSPEGAVQLRGRIGDATAQGAVDSFARAAFGAAQVSNGVRVAEAMPRGWTPRVLASLDALSLLHNGAATVEADRLAVSGVTGNDDARGEIARLLAERLGEGAAFELDIRYDERLDPVLDLPTPEECVRRINGLLERSKLSFDPGADTMDASASDTLDAMAELLKSCGEVAMEIGGYTDSQGRETMNQQLSQARADAVLTALSARRVPIANLTARGHGEADPIADNATEAGREANRRIAFRLLEDDAPAAELAAEGDGAGDGGDDGAEDGSGGE